ncbi:MAG: hypothetical protein RLZZ38_1943 [Bacteroidota bacterium]|jgi:hypothetical protein
MTNQKSEKALFAERLGLAINNKGIKQSPTVLCNLFNSSWSGRSITPHTARNWILGVAMPQQDKLVCLAKLLDTSPGQLRYGRSSEKTMVLSNGNLESEISNTDQEFFVRYLKLDEARKRLARDVVMEFSNSESNH